MSSWARAVPIRPRASGRDVALRIALVASIAVAMGLAVAVLWPGQESYVRLTDGSPFTQDSIKVAVDMRLGFKYTEDGAGDFLEELDVSGMSVNDVIKATMSIHFSYNGDLYGLAFGTIAQFIDEIIDDTGRPVTVTRTGEDTWTIATSNEAALYLLDWKNGHIHYGNSIMPFKVTLVVQQ